MHEDEPTYLNDTTAQRRVDESTSQQPDCMCTRRRPHGRPAKTTTPIQSSALLSKNSTHTRESTTARRRHTGMGAWRCVLCGAGCFGEKVRLFCSFDKSMARRRRHGGTTARRRQDMMARQQQRRRHDSTADGTTTHSTTAQQHSTRRHQRTTAEDDDPDDSTRRERQSQRPRTW